MQRTASEMDEQTSRQSLRILFAVTQDALAPGPRYRVFQYLPHFRAAGLECTVLRGQTTRATQRSIGITVRPTHARAMHYIAGWLTNLIFQLRIVASASKYDRIVLYRVPISTLTRWLLRHRRPDIVFDFDDALDSLTAAGAGPLKAWILRRGLHNAVLASTVTITSNEHNCRTVERLGGRAIHIPTSIDVDRLSFRDRITPLEDRLVIGWMGTPSTAEYLVGVQAALERVVRTRDVVVRLVGAGYNPLHPLEADIRDWSLERENQELAHFDIGIMPMPDSVYTRGKAATKALQYGASGAPTVAALTPTNVAILGEGDGTLFARTTDEWAAALLRLIDDPALRSRMGCRGRERVMKRYSVSVNAPTLVKVLRHPSSSRPAQAVLTTA